jgi:hypothetical protein
MKPLPAAVMAAFLVSTGCVDFDTRPATPRTETRTVDRQGAETVQAEIAMAAGELRVRGGAKSLMEIEKMAEGNSLLYPDQLRHEYESRGLFITTLTMDDLRLDPGRCGVAGSPTKVYKVESVVLSGGDRRMIEPTKAGLGALIDELMADHILG